MSTHATGYETASFWIAIASLGVSLAATWIAKSSLSQARQVAEREKRDWTQRKWFDLYLKANQAYDSLDFARTLYEAEPPIVGPAEWFSKRDEHWSDTIFLLREVHAMAAVFPKNTTIDELFSWTMGHSDPRQALSNERMEKLFNAVNGL